MTVVVVIAAAAAIPWRPRKGRPIVLGVLVYYQGPRRVTFLGLILDNKETLQYACIDLSRRLVLKVFLTLV
jgi:hypothetical protein